MPIAYVEYFREERTSGEEFEKSARRNFMSEGGQFVSHAPWFGRKFAGTMLINCLLERDKKRQIVTKLEQTVPHRHLVEAGCLDNPLTSIWQYNSAAITLVDPTLVERPNESTSCPIYIENTDILSYAKGKHAPKNAICVSTHSFIDGIVDSEYMKKFAILSAQLGWIHFHELDTVQNVRAFLDAGYKIIGAYDITFNPKEVPSDIENVSIDSEWYRRERPKDIPLNNEYSRFFFELNQ